MIASLARKAGMVVVKNIWWLPWPALAGRGLRADLPSSSPAVARRSAVRCTAVIEGWREED